MEITYPAGCPGKDNPGPVGRASLSGSGAEKSSSPGLRYFSAPAPAPRAYESSRGNRPVRDIKPHNILFICLRDKNNNIRVSGKHVRPTVKTVRCYADYESKFEIEAER